MADVVDVEERHVGEERQQVLQPVERVGLPHPASDEERGEFAERHLRLQLRQPVTRFVQLVVELPSDGFGLDAGWMFRWTYGGESRSS